MGSFRLSISAILICVCEAACSGGQPLWQPLSIVPTVHEYDAYFAQAPEASPSDLDVPSKVPAYLHDATQQPAHSLEKIKDSTREITDADCWIEYESEDCELVHNSVTRSGCCGSRGWYAAVQMNFLRAHLLESGALGKLSEQYAFSPRFELAYENCCGQGGRVRYWHYGHQTPSISSPGDGIRFDLDVVDLELTKRIRCMRTDVLFAGGVRMANFEQSNLGSTARIDLVGLTLATDLATILCCDHSQSWSWIYGGRVSLMAGDWQGSSGTDDLVYIPRRRDDNFFVRELYTGIEYACYHCGYEFFARLTFELQNWHSDAFVERDSVSFIGPGMQVGLGF